LVEKLNIKLEDIGSFKRFAYWLGYFALPTLLALVFVPVMPLLIPVYILYFLIALLTNTKITERGIQINIEGVLPKNPYLALAIKESGHFASSYLYMYTIGAEIHGVLASSDYLKEHPILKPIGEVVSKWSHALEDQEGLYQQVYI
jgi:hypothetical protein